MKYRKQNSNIHGPDQQPSWSSRLLLSCLPFWNADMRYSDCCIGMREDAREVS